MIPDNLPTVPAVLIEYSRSVSISLYTIDGELKTLKKYANGLITRDRIIDVCKDLFCKKGYKDTKYAEICKKAKVNPGTIAHHFKGKKSIAVVLFNEIMDCFYNKTAELFPDEDDLQQVMIAAGMHQKLLFTDGIYRRFSSEYSNESFSQDDLNSYKKPVLKAYEATKARVGQKRADFLFTAYKGMDCYIELYIDEHIDELSFDEVFEYIAVLYYQYLKGKELQSRIKKALDLLNTVNITFNHFDVSISICGCHKTSTLGQLP
jgi:AcrR family transcriptional regulator